MIFLLESKYECPLLKAIFFILVLDDHIFEKSHDCINVAIKYQPEFLEPAKLSHTLWTDPFSLADVQPRARL